MFFCLGAGFMLIETKGVTQLGLIFGNTWSVLAVVIASILLMGYLANRWVSMYWGYTSLYPLGMALYGLAFVCSLRAARSSREAVPSQGVEAPRLAA